MKRKHLIFFSFAMLLCFCIFATGAFAKDPQLKPKRLASIGDSITEAIDAEVYGANHWASWANGYHGFWQWLFGLSNVKSHNQRITWEFGRRGRKNFMEAESGADSFDLPGQAAQAVAHQATYVPWLMGHNDICQDYESQIPDEEDFEENAWQALIKLSELPKGATIYVVGMVNVPMLYTVAKDKKALGIVDCEVLWFFTLFELFPCGTILGPSRTETDKMIMRDRIEGSEVYEGFNPILKRLVATISKEDLDHYYYYTDDVFKYSAEAFPESHVSDLDCFHPSPEGQEELSRITWEAESGPNFQDW
jgi:lysophospholipase L1-like esterase